MNKKFVADAHILLCTVYDFCVLHKKSLEDSFYGAAETSPSSSAEIKCLHLFPEIKALEGSESYDIVISYETEEFYGLVHEK